MPLRIVPAYTLAVEPEQAVEVLEAQHKPFDVFLRVHSYSTKAAKITVGLDVPDGLHASAPVDLTFDGVGDQYAKFTVIPPAKLAPGDFTITAYARRGDETFSTSLNRFPPCPIFAGSFLAGQLPLHHHLRGDAGVVGAGQPQGAAAAHAPPADEDVHLRLVEHVAHVQATGDVGRGQEDGKGFAGLAAGLAVHSRCSGSRDGAGARAMRHAAAGCRNARD